MAIFDKNVRKTVKNNSINEKKNSKANQPHNHVSKFQKKLSSHFRDMTSNGRMDGPTEGRRTTTHGIRLRITSGNLIKLKWDMINYLLTIYIQDIHIHKCHL